MTGYVGLRFKVQDRRATVCSAQISYAVHNVRTSGEAGAVIGQLLLLCSSYIEIALRRYTVPQQHHQPDHGVTR
jgi:hypothetical protein